jgi:hypothetical protein
MDMYSVQVEIFVQANDRKDAEQIIEDLIKSNEANKLWRIGSVIKFENKAPARA